MLWARSAFLQTILEAAVGLPSMYGNVGLARASAFTRQL